MNTTPPSPVITDDMNRARQVLPLDPSPIEVISGSSLCRLRVWTEAEWAALSPSERPRDSVHAPGLGWVGAVPVESLN